MTQPRILLSTPNVAYQQRLRQAFGGSLNGDLAWLRDIEDPRVLTKRVEASGADVLALGPDFPIDDALEIAATFDRQRPDLSVVLIAKATTDLYQRALRAGVCDLLDPDALDREINDVLSRAMQLATDRRASLATDDAPTGGRVVAVLSPKGGSGKTTVATNVALGLAALAPGEVVLVDLDLQFGDAVGGLGLVPEHTILDVARAVKSLDAMTLKVFLTPHESQLYTLCAPESPAEGEEVTSEQVGRILRLLAAEFAYVVVDTSAGIDEHALVAAESATDFVLVCSMDVPSVRGMRKEVAALDQLGMVHQTRHFVLNRADSRVGLDVADIEATVGMPVDVALPSTRDIPLSVNQGVPLIELKPRSAVARQFHDFAARLSDRTTDTNADERSSTGFSWFWRSS